MKTLHVTARSRAIELPAENQPLPDSFVWMPAGTHEVSAGLRGGGRFDGMVIADEQAAKSVQESFERVLAEGRRSWVDFNHEDGKAAGWVKAFSWDASRGIVAAVEWTPEGERALREKQFYSFSPAFEIDHATGRVEGLHEGFACGGLVNAPAFGAAMPALVAASLAPSAELDAAKSRIGVLETELASERAKRVDDRVDPAVREGAITPAVAAGLKEACRAAPDRADAILASIPERRETPAHGVVVISPSTDSPHRGDLTAYELYLQKVKKNS